VTTPQDTHPTAETSGASAAASAASSAASSALVEENARLRAEVARMQEERAVRDRFFTQFISIVGHDLRSPLSAIVMATALLGKVPLDERAARALLRIHTSSKRAERLIRDLVDCARASAGAGIPLSRATMELHDVARQIVDEMALAFPERRITLAVSGETRGEWDDERMGQVIANLVTYAVRSSGAQSDVRVEVDGDDEEVRLLVCNQGGDLIDANALPHLFEPFGRAAEQGGDGISLYIVAEIVKAHGGRVAARSSRGEGTTLIAHLPR
jgi:sigma-B regulation protein RsbU (phosphoserine phosphatase)